MKRITIDFYIQAQKSFLKTGAGHFSDYPFLLITQLGIKNWIMKGPNKSIVSLRRDTGSIKIAGRKNLIQETGSCGKTKVEDALILVGWLSYAHF